jgi:hypothetical protein
MDRRTSLKIGTFSRWLQSGQYIFSFPGRGPGRKKYEAGELTEAETGKRSGVTFHQVAIAQLNTRLDGSCQQSEAASPTAGGFPDMTFAARPR